MIRGSKYPQLSDAEWLREQYEVLGKSCTDIASVLGTTSGRVSHWLRRHDIPARGRYPGQWKPKACERCGTEFTPGAPAQRFCSLECRPDAQGCEQCGKLFRADPPQQRRGSIYRRRFCSFECQAAWRSENCTHRYLTEDGYVVVKTPPTGHRDIKDGYVRINRGTGKHGNGRVREHRLVMEQQIGRPLHPDETVHHKNGVKTDNSPGNLELWVSRHPKGQRVEDVVEFAVEILERYAPERLR